MDESITCKSCRFSRGKLTHPDLQPGTKKCHRFPPQLNAFLTPGRSGHPEIVGMADWPVVQEAMFCGEHALPSGLLT